VLRVKKAVTTVLMGEVCLVAKLALLFTDQRSGGYVSGNQRVDRTSNQSGLSGNHSQLVLWGSAKARNNQLSPASTGKRWSLLRGHIWAHTGLAVLLR
jgi:hypothetical protein